MRTTRILALGLLLTVAAGCAGTSGGAQVASAGGATPTASTSAAATKDEDAPLKFAQCMREQGITWFPDPKEGRLEIKIPKGQDKEKIDAAMEACKKYAPNGGEPEKMDPERLEQARQRSQCMRDNGVTNFPDPDPNGRMHINGDKLGMTPDDPTFKKAEEACAKYRPPGAKGDTKKNDTASETAIG
jgi:hypothetical protein